MFAIGFIGNYPQESEVLHDVVFGEFNESTGSLVAHGDPVLIPMPTSFAYLCAPPRPENLTYA